MSDDNNSNNNNLSKNHAKSDSNQQNEKLKRNPTEIVNNTNQSNESSNDSLELKKALAFLLNKECKFSSKCIKVKKISLEKKKEYLIQKQQLSAETAEKAISIYQMMVAEMNSKYKQLNKKLTKC